jgi:hypothetical protein
VSWSISVSSAVSNERCEAEAQNCGFQIGAKGATNDKTPCRFLAILGITKRNVMVYALSWFWDETTKTKYLSNYLIKNIVNMVVLIPLVAGK